ncbi:MAG: CHAT domain-containing protein [Phaeodactylibacter sp.]|nr:CHAT domain-containing protein [Phaeodactylibacter sp.]
MRSTTLLLLASLFLWTACREEPLPSSPECLQIDSLLQSVPDKFRRANTLPGLCKACRDTHSEVWEDQKLWTNGVIQLIRSIDSFQLYPQDSLIRDAIDQSWWPENDVTGQFYIRLGWFLSVQGKYDEAKSAYEKARDLFEGSTRKMTSRPGRNIYRGLANIHTRLGENEEAIGYLQKAITYLTENEDWDALARTYNDLGIAYWNQSDLDLAKAEYEKGLALTNTYLADTSQAAIHARLRSTKCLFLYNIAQILVEQGQASAAILLIRQGHSEEPDGPYVSESYPIMSAAFSQLNQLDSAEYYYKKAFSELLEAYDSPYRRELSKIELALARLELQQQHFAQALAYTQRALSRVIGVDPNDWQTNPKPQDFTPEITILEALSLKAEILYTQYLANRNTSTLNHAAATTRLAIEMAEFHREQYAYQSSSLSLQQYSHSLYEQMQDILHEKYSQKASEAVLREAFLFSERSRAIILNQTLSKKDLAASILSTADLQRLKNLQSSISDLKNERFAARSSDDQEAVQAIEQELFDLNQDLNQLEAQIKTDARFQQLELAFSPADFDALQAELRRRELLLIEFFMGEKALYRYSFSGSYPSFKKIPINDELRRQFNTLNLHLYQKDSISNVIFAPDIVKAFASAAEGLYAILLADLLGSTATKQLLVIPDGQLGRIPFNVLARPTAENTPQNYELDYLVHHYSISQAHSAKSLLLTNPDVKIPKAHAYLGCLPSYANSPLPSVEDAQPVLQTLVAQFGGKYLTKEQATVEMFKSEAPKYRIIHFLGHAQALSDNPEFSWMAFTEPKRRSDCPNDQRTPEIPQSTCSMLFAKDIIPLNLNANLIILSACQTGQGKYAKGEGVLSLARAFRLAGCPHTMISLWEANFEVSKVVVGAFFNQLQQGKATDQALQAAILSFLQDTDFYDFHHPLFWANFSLQGFPQVIL